MGKKTFSIVIPVYNTENYIIRCLKSISKQNYHNYEIIIVNDGSSDKSEELITSFISNNSLSTIKYIKQPNRGLSNARNVGLDSAEGDYIIWLDSDDALAEGALEKLSILTKYNPDVIVNRISSYFENNESVIECKYTFGMEDVVNKDRLINKVLSLKGFWYAAWCFVPKRHFLIANNIRFFEGIYHEDELWSPTVMKYAETAIFNNSAYYLNTASRPGSIITKTNIKKEMDKLTICCELKKIPVETNAEIKLIKHRIIRILYQVYANLNKYLDDKEYVELKSLYNKTMKKMFGVRCFIYNMMFIIRKVKG